MRRLAIVFVVAGSCSLLFAAPASAFCAIRPFDKVLRQSDAAWWVTVTDAAASAKREPGYWRLTVRVDDALKGPPDDQAVATVFVASCGLLIDDETEEGAATFVGQRLFYMGDVNAKGAMIAYSDVLRPQGLSPDEQYERGLRTLDLDRPTRVLPLPLVAGGLPSWIPALIAVVALGAIILLARPRRSGHI